jgi:hypothetical protein
MSVTGSSYYTSGGGNATAVGKNEPSKRHGRDPSISHSTETQGKQVPAESTDPSVSSSQDKDDTHHGMLASAQHAIHNATETIKHFLRMSY